MARKLCRECRAEVRTNARFCPHCGVRSPLARDPLAALDLRVSYGARRVTRFAIVATLFVLLSGLRLHDVGTVQSVTTTVLRAGDRSITARRAIGERTGSITRSVIVRNRLGQMHRQR